MRRRAGQVGGVREAPGLELGWAGGSPMASGTALLGKLQGLWRTGMSNTEAADGRSTGGRLEMCYIYPYFCENN